MDIPFLLFVKGSHTEGQQHQLTRVTALLIRTTDARDAHRYRRAYEVSLLIQFKFQPVTKYVRPYGTALYCYP